jgi:membrane protease YdiL (CAAX protease family)
MGSGVSFSLFTFWQHPYQTVAFFALIMSFASLWIKRTAWLWGSFLVMAYLLAFHSGVVTGWSLPFLAALGALFWALHHHVSGTSRAVLVAIATALSIALSFHIVPGFHNWAIATDLCLGGASTPYNLWFSFDKPFIGIFVLAWSVPLIQNKAQFRSVLKSTLPLSLLGVGLLLSFSLYAGVIAWDPKFPLLLFLPWALSNLFLITIPEEAFFRGFIQKELFQWLGKGGWAHVGTILATALFFTVLNIAWVPHPLFLAAVFAAGVVYGTLYQYTQAIESSIFCHFAVNVLHFLFFTYPMRG